MHHRFLDYGSGRPAGRQEERVLVADRVGSVVAFALGNRRSGKAQMFVTPETRCMKGWSPGRIPGLVTWTSM